MSTSAPRIWTKAIWGWCVAGAVLAGMELLARQWVPLAAQPEAMDRFALADVGAGAYVHRRDRSVGSWLESTAERVRTRAARHAEGVAPLDVPREPVAGVPRVVVLGGSTTRGVPYDHEGGGFVSELSRWSRHSLEVINLGVPGMDARGVEAMAREVRQLSPDLLVVYTGNNEVVGDLLDSCVRPGRIWLSRTFDRLLLFRLLRQSLLGPLEAAGSEEALRAQDACMDARVAEAWSTGRVQWAESSGMAPDSPARMPGPRWDVAAGSVQARLSDALDGLALQAAQLGVEVVLVKPARNLRHPPERALGAPGSDRSRAAHVDAFLATASTQGHRAWSEALRLDAHRADVLHGWGMSLLSEGGAPWAAARALQASIDHDYRSRRPTSTVLNTIEETCERWPLVRCVDAHAELAVQANSPVLPEEWFYDHCHPSREGHRRIARIVASAVDAALAARTPK